LRSQDGGCDFYEWQPIYAVRPEVAAAIAGRGAPFQGPADGPNTASPSAATVQVAPLGDEDLKPLPNGSQASPRRNHEERGLAGAYAAQIPVVSIMLSVVNLMVSVLVLALLLAVMLKLYFE
jgi:hypothetical protein